jgi:hypothetical protein
MKQIELGRKFVACIAILILASVALGSILTRTYFPQIGIIIVAGPEDPLEAWSEASYIIWQYNTTHYASRNMSTNMVETVSSNASTVINNAIGNATNSICQKRVVLLGYFVTDSTILMRDHVWLDGPATIVLKNGANRNVINNSDSTGASGTGNTECKITNLSIDGNRTGQTWTSDPFNCGIYWRVASDYYGPEISLTLEDLNITSCWNGVYIQSPPKAVVGDNVRIYDSRQKSLYIWGSDEIWSNCIINGQQGMDGFGYSVEVAGGGAIGFSNCYFGGSGGAPAQLYIHDCVDVQFTGCFVDHSAGGYAFVNVNSSSVIGGKITGIGYDLNNTYNAINVTGTSYFNRFVGIFMSGSTSAYTMKYGINLGASTVQYNIVADNTYALYGTAKTNDLGSNNGWDNNVG